MTAHRLPAATKQLLLHNRKSLNQRRNCAGAAAPKVLLLVLFLAALVGYFAWKAGYGFTGNVSPMPTSTAGRIVFVRRDATGSNLYLINADGTGEQRLTDDTTQKRSPAWSPDGRKICFSGETPGEGGKAFQLFALGGEGHATQFTQGSGSKESPQWRPDGKEIAFLEGGAIKVIEPNGSHLDQVFPPVHKGGGPSGADNEQQDDMAGVGFKAPPITFFRWSPTGVSIAGVQVTDSEESDAVGRSDWWEKQSGQPAADAPPTGGSEPERMLLLPTLDTRPVPIPFAMGKQIGFDWLPDGKQLAIAVVLNSQFGIGLLRTDEMGAQPQGLFTSHGYGVAPRNPAVSPDGSQIAFEAVRMSSAEDSTQLGIAVLPIDPQHGLSVASAADAAKLPIRIPGNATRPAWSPDGKRLLYQVEDAHGSNLWVADADGSHQVQLTHTGDNFDASWSPAR